MNRTRYCVPVAALVGSAAILLAGSFVSAGGREARGYTACPPNTGRAGTGTLEYFAEGVEGDPAYVAVLKSAGTVAHLENRDVAPVEIDVERIPGPPESDEDTAEEFWRIEPLVEPPPKGEMLCFRFTVEPTDFTVGWVSLIPAGRGGYLVETIRSCYDSGTETM